MLLPNRHGATDSYRYGFNGKEKDDEVKGEGLQIDYGFRIYDTRLGKFLSTDPLFQTYPHYTPYQFAGNNPIRFIDLDGLEEADHGSNFSIAAFLEFFFGATTPGQIMENSSTEEGRNRNERNNEVAKKALKFGAKLEKFKTTTLEVADYVLPVEFANQIITGKNIDGSEATPDQIALNALTIIPLAKIGGKGIKIAGKYGDELYDISTAVASAFKKYKPCGCFTSGTQVYTEDGHKNIEEIQLGDFVWAFDDKSGKIALKEVVNTFTREFTEIHKIYFDNEVIEATHEHPFFIGGKWLKVDEIKEGYELSLYDGVKVIVDRIDFVKGNFKVYNFTVDDYHTYFVSKKNVLVHNGDPCELAFKKFNVLRNTILEGVENSKLKNHLDGLYKSKVTGDKIIGNGSAMDAARYTIATGELVGGTDHISKLQQAKAGLEQLLNGTSRSGGTRKNPVFHTLNEADRATTSSLIEEITNILKSAVTD